MFMITLALRTIPFGTKPSRSRSLSKTMPPVRPPAPVTSTLLIDGEVDIPGVAACPNLYQTTFTSGVSRCPKVPR